MGWPWGLRICRGGRGVDGARDPYDGFDAVLCGGGDVGGGADFGAWAGGDERERPAWAGGDRADCGRCPDRGVWVCERGAWVFRVPPEHAGGAAAVRDGDLRDDGDFVFGEFGG